MNQNKEQTSHMFAAPFWLTGSSVSGHTADVVSAPCFHSNGVEPPRRQIVEHAVVVFGRDALVLQNAVVVTDQDHVTLQITCGVTPVDLNTTQRRTTRDCAHIKALYAEQACLAQKRRLSANGR